MKEARLTMPSAVSYNEMQNWFLEVQKSFKFGTVSFTSYGPEALAHG